MEKKLKKFIDKSTKKHNGYYSYDKVRYINSTTCVEIVCPVHGSFFQTPASHVRGCGCPECGKTKKRRLSLEEFKTRANKIHKEKYDYSKVKFANVNDKIEIICPIHGSFLQTVESHLRGRGCPKCKGRNLTNEEIIEKFISVHGDKYDYSKVKFTKMNSKVDIICKKHGVFQQTPLKHIKGQGCPKCSIEKKADNNRFTRDEFIEIAKKIHGDKYDYSLVEYFLMKDKVKIICSKHGVFSMRPYDHLQGHSCPVCGMLISNAEEEITNFIRNIDGNISIIRNSRDIIKPLEIDIFLPEYNIGIEYNGLKWHSEEFGKDRWYHLNKLRKCKEKGIRLIQIFEDEFILNKNIVLEKIKHLINIDNINKDKIMGRKCFITEINVDIVKNFLDEYHIQGYVGSKVYLGAFYDNKLIGVMLFKKTNNNKKTWELTRFASDYHYICQGIGGKLFKYFIRKYNPDEIKSFADRRWTINEDNNVYIQLGFKFDGYTLPNYSYYDSKTKERKHKSNFRKQRLHKKYDLPLTMTESEMAKELGVYKVWDCGLIRYVWKKNHF